MKRCLLEGIVDVVFLLRIGSTKSASTSLSGHTGHYFHHELIALPPHYDSVVINGFALIVKKGLLKLMPLDVKGPVK